MGNKRQGVELCLSSEWFEKLLRGPCGLSSCAGGRWDRWGSPMAHGPWGSLSLVFAALSVCGAIDSLGARPSVSWSPPIEKYCSPWAFISGVPQPDTHVYRETTRASPEQVHPLGQLSMAVSSKSKRQDPPRAPQTLRAANTRNNDPQRIVSKLLGSSRLRNAAFLRAT